MSDHEDFEGLAAGYALHALEPEEEQRLAAHLLTCQDCARLVADAAKSPLVKKLGSPDQFRAGLTVNYSFGLSGL